MLTPQLSLLQSSVSHDPSEVSLKCWISARKTSLINVFFLKQPCCLIFLENIFFQDFLINRKFKHHLFEIKIFVNILNVFTVKLSLMCPFWIEVLISLKKPNWPKLLNCFKMLEYPVNLMQAVCIINKTRQLMSLPWRPWICGKVWEPKRKPPPHSSER